MNIKKMVDLYPVDTHYCDWPNYKKSLGLTSWRLGGGYASGEIEWVNIDVKDLVQGLQEEAVTHYPKQEDEPPDGYYLRGLMFGRLLAKKILAQSPEVRGVFSQQSSSFEPWLWGLNTVIEVWHLMVFEQMTGKYNGWLGKWETKNVGYAERSSKKFGYQYNLYNGHYYCTRTMPEKVIADFSDALEKFVRVHGARDVVGNIIYL